MSPSDLSLPLPVYPCRSSLERSRGDSSIDATAIDERIGCMSAWVVSEFSRAFWVRWSAASSARFFTDSVWCGLFSSRPSLSPPAQDAMDCSQRDKISILIGLPDRDGCHPSAFALPTDVSFFGLTSTVYDRHSSSFSLASTSGVGHIDDVL